MSVQVPPSGPLDCQICLVGEAPGADEVTDLRPFSGKSGKLLDQWLSLLGLHRDLCYVTNVVKERPPKNNISTFIHEKKKTTKGLQSTVFVTTPEYDAYEQALWAELAQCTANVFVPLGNVALYALTRRWGITKFRGSILECTAPGLEGRKVIPTIHPAASLRQPITRLLTLHDLDKAKREQGSPTIRRPEYNLVLDPGYCIIGDLLNAAARSTHIGFDIETTVVKQGSRKIVKEMFMFSIALPTDPVTAFVVSLINADGTPKWTTAQECDIMGWLAEVLTNPKVTKVGQNLIFDSTVLYERYGIQCWPIDDTMVAHRIAFPEFPADLGHITSMYTDEPYYKDTGGKFFDGKTVLWEDFLRYSAMDSVICLEAMPQLKADLVKQRNLEVYQTHIACHRPILYMQARGYSVDMEMKDKLRREVLQDIKAQQTVVDALATRSYAPKSNKTQKQLLNTRSTDQLKAFFLERGVKLPISHGKSTSDKKALAKLTAKGVPEAKLIGDLRQKENDYSKYWNCRLDADGRIRGAYQPHGAISGRFSSTMTIWGKGSNAQNRPSRMKNILRRDPGHLPIVVDLSQAENRIVAYLARDQRMMNAFETGQDVHRLTAGLIFGITPDQISNEKGSSHLSGGAYSQRYWGKKMNHSGNYNIGDYQLAEDLQILISEAKWLLNAYHRAYPNVRGVFQADVKDNLYKRKMLHNLRGRTLKVFGTITHDLINTGFAWGPSSTVADIINPQGLIPLYENQAQWSRFEIMNQIHDSIELQIPIANDDDLLYCARGLQALVASLEVSLVAHGRTFVIPAEVEVGSFSEGTKVNVRGTVEEVAGRLEKVWTALQGEQK